MRFTILVAALAILAGCSQKGYVIEGNISGDADGKTVYLYSGAGPFFTPEDVLDSAVITNGRFEFRSDTPAADLLTVKIFPDDTRGMGERGYIFRPVVPVFVETGKVSIEAALDDIPLDNFDGTYDFSKVSITGSPLQELFRGYMDRKADLVKNVRDAGTDYYAYLRNRSGHVSEGIAGVGKIDRAKAEQKAYVRSFVSQNSSNLVGAYALRDNLSLFNADEIGTLVGSLSPEVRSGAFGSGIVAEAERVKASAVGSPYIDFTLVDTVGNEVKISDHAGRGKWLLLEFWASWCGPCRADIPHLKEVYSLYHPEGFEVVSISMDTDKDMWLKAVEQEQMPWLQVWNKEGFEGGLSKAYNFQGIPTCILIDPDGMIADRNMRGSWMDRRLIELYNNRFGDKY